MVNFDELLHEFDNVAPIFPKEIFENNIRDKKFPYLRSDQEKVLNTWYEKKEQKDTIIKMNTGGGKTTVGLLQLQSSINQGIGPGLYLCLDKQLVQQVLEDAKNIGINCVEITDDNRIPVEFYNSEAILVTTFQKMFNGYSIFGIQGDTSREAIEIGAIVIDDAHSALLKAREAFTLNFPIDSNNYKYIVNEFKDSLYNQAMGTANSILDGSDPYGILMVPYWTWLEKVGQVQKNLETNDDSVRLKWKLLRDYLEYCTVLISWNKVEITPICLPIHMIYGFNNATRRIFMSATLNDDSSLIKDFGVSKNAILNPITSSTYTDIGDKLIIAPFNIDSKFTRYEWADIMSKGKKHNVVTLVPSDRHAELWESNNFVKPRPNNIHEVLKDLKVNVGNHIVLSNRYDGIDLADDSCRILILDDLPLGSTLHERYNIFSRPNSRMMQMNQAQKIEQGLGRAVRSVNDYAVVFLIGQDLVSKMSNVNFRKFMTSQTIKQIELGKNIVNLIKKSNEDSLISIIIAMNQVLDRDPKWIQLHKRQLGNIEDTLQDNNLILTATTELEAFKLALSGRYEQAADVINRNLEEIAGANVSEEGWFIQLSAFYLYKLDRHKAMEKQLSAHSKNPYLLKPPHGVTYKKMINKKTTQSLKIQRFLENYVDNNSIILYIESLLDHIQFKPKSSAIFEQTLMEIGKCIGFETQRPDKEYGVGPDVLWNLYDNEYLIIEAKNEVELTRTEIFKHETEQISESINWFNQEYSGKKYIPILVHPTNILHRESFGPDELMILNPEKLNLFKNNIKDFFAKIAKEPLDSWRAEDIAIELKHYNLDKASINKYLVPKKKL